MFGLFCGELESQFVEQNLLMFRWPADAAFSDFDADPSWKDDIHRPDFAQFGQDAAGFVAQTGGLAELAERLP